MFVYRYFFPAFDSNKCKLYLRSAIIRLKLHRSKAEENIKRQRREILKLINEDNEDMAQIQVEQILRSEKMIEAYDILELFCELLQSKMAVLELTDDIPHDLREAACSIIWASLRVSVPEVNQIVQQFKLKFGEEFVKHAIENYNDCVNGQLMAKLTVEIPNAEIVQEYLLELSPLPDDGGDRIDVEGVTSDDHDPPTHMPEGYPSDGFPAGPPDSSFPTSGIPGAFSVGALPTGDLGGFTGGHLGGMSPHLNTAACIPPHATSPPRAGPVDAGAGGAEVDLDALAARFEALKRGL